jgi:hypothetical protein
MDAAARAFQGMRYDITAVQVRLGVLEDKLHPAAYITAAQAAERERYEKHRRTNQPTSASLNQPARAPGDRVKSQPCRRGTKRQDVGNASTPHVGHASRKTNQ